MCVCDLSLPSKKKLEYFIYAKTKMASGSSSSMLFFGTTGTTDNMDLMENCQQDSHILFSESLVPAQHYHHLVDPKKQSNQPEVSYPDADVAIVVSPTTLLDTNRYVCEVCYKGFPRKQNLALHRRAHNLPFTLKTKTPKDPVAKKVYLCPEPTCVNHNRSHGLGDFGGLRKHYLRKHCNQKNFKCDTCCKAYTVESDLRAHSKVCGAKKYHCHCGCCFSRGNTFTLHRENCDAPEVGAAISPQTRNIGDISDKSTRNTNISHGIGSVISHPPTLGMEDNSIRFNRNENSGNLIAPQISSIQNQSNSYYSVAPYQYQFGENHSSLMNNASMDLNFNHTPPTFFPPSSTHQNQHEYPEMSDIGFYADLLRDKVPLHNVSMIGDGGTSNYKTGEGSNSFSNGSFMFDPSSSLHLTQAMHSTGQNGILNPATGSSDGGGYGHGSCYDYGYGYGYGNGQY